MEFSSSFVCFNKIVKGFNKLENKPDRIDKLVELIRAILEKKIMDFKEALSIRGKVSYAEGQIFLSRRNH